MQIQAIISCILIIIGTGIMLDNIVNAKEPLQTMQFIPLKYQRSIKRYLDLQRGLMAFFFLGMLRSFAQLSSTFHR